MLYPFTSLDASIQSKRKKLVKIRLCLPHAVVYWADGLLSRQETRKTHNKRKGSIWKKSALVVPLCQEITVQRMERLVKRVQITWSEWQSPELWILKNSELRPLYQWPLSQLHHVFKIQSQLKK